MGEKFTIKIQIFATTKINDDIFHLGWGHEEGLGSPPDINFGSSEFPY